ncbi:MAG: GyrI-like domain-containing protein [Dehalococcoidia bacterium]
MTLSAIEIRQLPPQPTACIRRSLRYSQTSTIPELIGRVAEALAEAGLELVGRPYTRVLSLGLLSMEVEVGWPVPAPFAGRGEVTAGELPGGPAAVASYFGPYEDIRPAYEAIAAWCRDHGRAVAGSPWESYCTDPSEEPDSAKWRTDVAFPLRDT